MSWVETIPGFGGLVVAVYAALRQRRHEHAEESEKKKADVTAWVRRESGSGGRPTSKLVVENLGPAAAGQVRAEPRSEELSESELKQLPIIRFQGIQMPLQRLDPGKSFSIPMMTFGGMLPSIPLRLSWNDGSGSRVKDLEVPTHG